MSQLQRLVLAVVIVLVDWALFFLPVCSVFEAYVSLVNPPWVRSFLNGLDPEGGSPAGDAS